MCFSLFCSITKEKTPKKGAVEERDLKIRINIVIFHCFIIILVTSKKKKIRFNVVKMAFNLKQTNETWFTYDTHIMLVSLNIYTIFFHFFVSPTTISPYDEHMKFT